MSWSRLQVTLPAPLAGFRVRSFGPPPVPAETVKAQVEEAYRKGQGEADDFHRQQLMQHREEAVSYQRDILLRLEQKIDTLLESSHQRIPELVFALVGRVLQGISLDAQELEALVVTTIGELHHREGEHLEVQLSPQDYDTLLTLQEEGKAESLKRLQFVSDERLSHGDVQVTSRFGLLDARLETKLAKIKREVLGE